MDGNLRKEGGRVYGQMPSHTSSHNGHSMKKKKVNKVNKSAVSHPPLPPGIYLMFVRKLYLYMDLY